MLVVSKGNSRTNGIKKKTKQTLLERVRPWKKSECCTCMHTVKQKKNRNFISVLFYFMNHEHSTRRRAEDIYENENNVGSNSRMKVGFRNVHC